MPTLPGMKVVRSKIHGYGVIATRDFEVGQVITYADGVVYKEDELGDDTYALWITDDIFMDMVDQTRWINHSCDPNSEVEADIGADGEAWARIVAIRPIRAGEEITYDYGFALDQAEPCSCGAPSCRGMILDAGELERLPQRDA